MTCGGCDALLDQVSARRYGQVRTDGERSRQSWVGAVEGDGMTGGAGGASSAFFDQQHSRGNVPFIAAGQGDHRIRLTGGHQGKRISDGSDRAAVEVGLKAFKPAHPQFPGIDERNRTFGGGEGWMIRI